MLESIGLKQLLDGEDLGKLIFRLVIDLTFALIVIRWLHYRMYRNRDLAFTYLLFNVITFSLCFLLRKVPIEMGFALGLFAVFGILRYRTEPIRTRDLTYLFVVIGLAILNAVANKKISLAELMTINVVITGLSWVMTWTPLGRREEVHQVVYDDLRLLGHENREALLQDLTARTGLRVQRVEVGDLDLLRDTAKLTITCLSERSAAHAPARKEDDDRCHDRTADLSVDPPVPSGR